MMSKPEHRCRHRLNDCLDHPRWHVYREDDHWAIVGPSIQSSYDTRPGTPWAFAVWAARLLAVAP